MVSEDFVDQAAFDHHQARTNTSAWATVTVGLDRHYKITVDDDRQSNAATAAPSSPNQGEPTGRRFHIPDRVQRRAISEGEPGLAWLATLDEVLAGIEQDTAQWNCRLPR
ncbi:MAG: hypothetical protein MO846_09870 [Candidatus Devosia symbiotica]|nr:hypothetical protein [Candidatus Devosia symbiotica]